MLGSDLAARTRSVELATERVAATERSWSRRPLPDADEQGAARVDAAIARLERARAVLAARRSLDQTLDEAVGLQRAGGRAAHPPRTCATSTRISSGPLDAMAGELASQLEDDHPCPVCGAHDHPHPASSADPVTADDVASAEARWQPAAEDLAAPSGLRPRSRPTLVQLRDQLGDEPGDQTRPAQAAARAGQSSPRSRRWRASRRAPAIRVTTLQAAPEPLSPDARATASLPPPWLPGSRTHGRGGGRPGGRGPAAPRPRRTLPLRRDRHPPASDRGRPTRSIPPVDRDDRPPRHGRQSSDAHSAAVPDLERARAGPPQSPRRPATRSPPAGFAGPSEARRGCSRRRGGPPPGRRGCPRRGRRARPHRHWPSPRSSRPSGRPR